MEHAGRCGCFGSRLESCGGLDHNGPDFRLAVGNHCAFVQFFDSCLCCFRAVLLQAVQRVTKEETCTFTHSVGRLEKAGLEKVEGSESMFHSSLSHDAMKNQDLKRTSCVHD